jgi:hypothetical protein
MDSAITMPLAWRRSDRAPAGALDAKPCNHVVILHGIMTTEWQRADTGDSELFEEVSYWTAPSAAHWSRLPVTVRSRVSRGRSQSAAAILDAAIGRTAGDRRTPAARATNPRVPRGASAENGRRDRCLAARSSHGGRSRWFTLALSDDRPCGLAFGQGSASPTCAEPPEQRDRSLYNNADRCRVQSETSPKQCPALRCENTRHLVDSKHGA